MNSRSPSARSETKASAVRARLRLASIFEEQRGDTKRARAELDAVLALEPDHRGALERRTALEARLGEPGVRLQKKGRGLVVTDGTRQVKASRIDRKGSIHKLEARFGMAFNDWRDRVGDLREAVETYEQAEKERHALHLQHAELKREVERARGRLAPFGELAQRQRLVKNRLQTQLRAIYGPDRVAETQRTLADLARSTGYARAAETLRREPAATEPEVRETSRHIPSLPNWKLPNTEPRLFDDQDTTALQSLSGRIECSGETFNHVRGAGVAKAKQNHAC